MSKSLVSRAVRSFNWRTQKLAHKGGDYYCPVCENPVDEFLPVPQWLLRGWQEHRHIHNIFNLETMNFADYRCPICDASDRERMYAVYLKDRLKPEMNMIEFGPVERLSTWLRKRVSLRTADLFNPADDVADLTNLPYPDNSFDVFLCSHVLEHVSDDRKAISELARILKPGGFGIAMVPIDLSLTEVYEFPVTTEGERWKHFGQDDHVRTYSKKGFVDRLSKHFEVEEIPMKDDRMAFDGVLYVVRH